MTRKRYIKLLMACGFSRNSAAQAARCVRDQLCGGGSYRRDAGSWMTIWRTMARFSRHASVKEELRCRAAILRQALREGAAHE